VAWTSRRQYSAISRYFPAANEIVNVHAGDAVAFGGFDAEGLAVEVKVEAARSAFAAADAVKVSCSARSQCGSTA